LEQALRARADQGAPRGGAFNPQDSAELFAQEFREDDYTPLDFAKQVGGFPGKVYNDADQMVRGLIDLGGNTVENTISGRAPFEGVEGDAIVESVIDQYSDPMAYANEHPFAFMADLAGAGALGARAVTSAAARTPFRTPAAWMADDTGAVGRLGKLLEERAMGGEEVGFIDNITSAKDYDDIASLVPSVESYYDSLPNGKFLGQRHRVRGSSAAPELGIVRDFDDPGLALLKPDNLAWVGDQTSPELFTQALNNAIQKRLGLAEPPVRMPGSARGSFDYQGLNKHGGKFNEADAYYTAGEEGVTPANGLVQEFLPRARNVSNDPQAQNIVESMDNAEDMQNISIMDYITANPDRSLEGHNLMEEGARPLAIDAGLGMRSLRDDLKYDPSGSFYPTHQQWPGLALEDRHRAILQAAKEALEDAVEPFFPEGGLKPFNAMYENAGEAEIQAAIARINSALGRDTLYEMNSYTHGAPQGLPFKPGFAEPQAPVGLNAFDDIEQPGVVEPGTEGARLQRWQGEAMDEGGTSPRSSVPTDEPNLEDLLALLRQQIPGL